MAYSIDPRLVQQAYGLGLQAPQFQGQVAPPPQIDPAMLGPSASAGVQQAAESIYKYAPQGQNPQLAPDLAAGMTEAGYNAGLGGGVKMPPRVRVPANARPQAMTAPRSVSDVNADDMRSAEGAKQAARQAEAASEEAIRQRNSGGMSAGGGTSYYDLVSNTAAGSDGNPATKQPRIPSGPGGDQTGTPQIDQGLMTAPDLTAYNKTTAQLEELINNRPKFWTRTDENAYYAKIHNLQNLQQTQYSTAMGTAAEKNQRLVNEMALRQGPAQKPPEMETTTRGGKIFERQKGSTGDFAPRMVTTPEQWSPLPTKVRPGPSAGAFAGSTSGAERLTPSERAQAEVEDKQFKPDTERWAPNGVDAEGHPISTSTLTGKSKVDMGITKSSSKDDLKPPTLNDIRAAKKDALEALRQTPGWEDKTPQQRAAAVDAEARKQLKAAQDFRKGGGAPADEPTGPGDASSYTTKGGSKVLIHRSQ